jgi:NADH:ubiquinone oxidoreductase subunit 6 (subunit J)
VLDRSGLTSGQLLSLLEYLTILLFVSAGLPGLAKRYRLRRAAVIVYAAAVLVALSLVVLWWAGVNSR